MWLGRSQNANIVTHTKGRLLRLPLILIICVPVQDEQILIMKEHPLMVWENSVSYLVIQGDLILFCNCVTAYWELRLCVDEFLSLQR